MMQWVKTEIDFCLKFEPGGSCYGAGGQKLRRVCIYCPNFERYRKRKQQEEKQKREDEQNEKDH